MIITTITVGIAFGKRREALELIKKAANMCNEEFSDCVTVSVLQPTNGDFERLIWVQQYESREAQTEFLEKSPEGKFFGPVREAMDKGYITNRVLNHYNGIDLAG